MKIDLGATPKAAAWLARQERARLEGRGFCKAEKVIVKGGAVGGGWYDGIPEVNPEQWLQDRAAGGFATASYIKSDGQALERLKGSFWGGDSWVRSSSLYNAPALPVIIQKCENEEGEARLVFSNLLTVGDLEVLWMLGFPEMGNGKAGYVYDESACVRLSDGDIENLPCEVDAWGRGVLLLCGGITVDGPLTAIKPKIASFLTNRRGFSSRYGATVRDLCRAARCSADDVRAALAWMVKSGEVSEIKNDDGGVFYL